MVQSYDDIVSVWYTRLRPEFLRRLTARYPKLTLCDAENIYQDTFIAVHENLMSGHIKEDTLWSNYIMSIGMNLASKTWRKKSKTNIPGDNEETSEVLVGINAVRKVEQFLKSLPSSDEEMPLYKNEDALSLLGNELIHTPEPCGSIIRLFYYENMKMDDIAKEIGYKNAATAKAKKSQCMSDLILRVTRALRKAGFDVTPKKRNYNGKN